MDFFARVRKAVAAGLAAGGAAYTTASASGALDQGDWSLVVGSVLVTALITYLVPNRTD